MFDTRYYQDPEISQNLKRLRTHCHLSNEALKEAVHVLRPPSQPDWRKVLSNLDVASVQLQLFEGKLHDSEVILQNIAVPLQDVRDGQRPSIPTILDSGQEPSVEEKTFLMLESSPFGTMSNKVLEERRKKFNEMVDGMAKDSAEWRDRIQKIKKMKQAQEVALALTGAQAAGTSESPSSSISAFSGKNQSLLLGKRQRETIDMKDGLDAFTFMAAMM